VSVAFGIEHATGMGYTMLSSMASLAKPYFSTLSQKSVFGGKKTLLNVNVLIFTTTFVLTFFILRRRRGRKDKKCV
jgi:hypothetical protein